MSDTNSAFTPHNALEEALVRAMANDERLAFYQDLLAADIWVLGTADLSNPEERSANDAAVLAVYNWEVDGRRVVPLFSSLARLQDFVTEEEAYIRINAGALLSALDPQLDLVLNPGSPVALEFKPAEVQALLDDAIFAPEDVADLKSDGEVFVGQPAEYPHALVGALHAFLAEREDVHAAYLAQLYIPDAAEPPHIVIGLDILRNFEAVVEACADIAAAALAEGEFVDFVQIGRDGLSNYLLYETQPFFKR